LCDRKFVETLKRKIVARNKKQHKKPVKMLRAPVGRFPLPHEDDSRTRESRMMSAPFLKWAGGKRQLLAQIEALLPERIDTYFEPFLGGAAVFFRLAAGGRFKRAVLADANAELVNCYQAIRDDVDGVIAELRRYRNESALYYRVRRRDPAKLSPTARAGRLIYLNRCGYNGLYRVNSRGEFNVPFGRYRRPLICDEPRLRAAAAALQKATIVHGDFATTLRNVQPGDFAYLDPPYVPLSATSSFTAYAARDFGAAEQQRLADLLRALAARKIPALLSNSDCATTRELYRGFDRIDRVTARRAINSVGQGRGPVDELLVRSFDYPVAGSGAVTILKSGYGTGQPRRRRSGPVDGVTR
jgi:DNA adenine methylase